MFDGKLLADECVLSDYNIQDECILQLEMIPLVMQIFIKSSMENVIIFPSDTIKSLKVKIQEEENIPTDKQDLMCTGKFLKEECTLSDYNVKNIATLHLRIRPRQTMNIIVKMITGRIINLEVRRSFR